MAGTEWTKEKKQERREETSKITLEEVILSDINRWSSACDFQCIRQKTQMRTVTSLHPSDLVTNSTADAASSRLDDRQHSHTIHMSHT